MTTKATERRWEGKLFIGGKFVEPESGRTLPVFEKATRQELAEAGVATGSDLDRAVKVARAAQLEWATRSYEERASLVRRVAAVLEERSEELAGWLVRETGGIRPKAEYEIHASVNELHEAAGLLTRAVGEILPSHFAGKTNIIQRVPVGTVGLITPWNFPLLLAMRAIAPALALGNAVILKPAEETPIAGGLLVADLFESVGAPQGLLQVLPDTGGEVGEQLVKHPGVDMIHFTGSAEVGRLIAEQAGRDLKKVELELGGNNAFVVLDDADIDMASMVGAWSTYHYQGQTCITATRHIVMRQVAEEYSERLAARARNIPVGDPATGEVGLGPMINERQRDRAHGLLTRSVDDGASVVEGGTYEGLFYRPTVVRDVTAEMPLFKEEVFAPIAPITIVDSEDEALELTNRTEYGLVNAVYTGDLDRGLAFAECVRSGMVHVNDSTVLDEPHIPFGGLGASGLGGRVGGEANLEAFTERRWLSVQRAPVQYPF